MRSIQSLRTGGACPGGRAVQVTASVGVGVAVGTDLVDADALVEAADRALYQARSEGRDSMIGVDLAQPAERAIENR